MLRLLENLVLFVIFAMLGIGVLPSAHAIPIDGSPIKENSDVVIPEFFYRSVPSIEFSRTGLLQPVDEPDIRDLEAYGRHSLPLVHPDELHEVLKYFYRYAARSFILLKIETEKVSQLLHRPHPSLPVYGEYFAEIPKEAIVGVSYFDYVSVDGRNIVIRKNKGDFDIAPNLFIEVQEASTSACDQPFQSN